MKDHIVEISGEKGDGVPQAPHSPAQLAVSTSVTSPVGVINDSQQGGLEGYRISLEGVFLPVANINIPYETIFTSWQDAFSKYLTMSEAEFFELLPKPNGGETDKSAEYFLNLTLQQIVEEPIDPVLEKALEIKQVGSEGGVDSLARVFEFAAENFDRRDDKYDNKIISVAQTLQITPVEFKPLSILQPLILQPDDPIPSAPSQTFIFGEPDAGNALIPEISEIYLNTYQSVEIRGNLFATGMPFGFTVGADYGAGAGPGFVSASFSSENISGGSLSSPIPGELIFTTAEGNTFTFYTAAVAGHAVGDFFYTLINPINTPINPNHIALYAEHFLYGISNNFNNSAVGNLIYKITNDVPVTHDRIASQLNESDISLVGSSHSLQPEISVGTLLTTFNPTGTLIISPNVPFNPVLPNAATDNYFGGDGGSVTNIVLDSVVGATGVTGSAFVSTLISSTEFAYFTAAGLIGSNVGDAALMVNLSNGNSLIIDALTAQYVLVLNSAIHHTIPDTIATLNFKFTFTDTDGDTSTSTLTFNVNDDKPLAYNTTNSIDETALFVKIQNDPLATETKTGNILTDGPTDSVFGADGGKINSITVGNVTDNTTKTITDNGFGDLDLTVGVIKAETKYGSIILDTEGVGVGQYTYTLDKAKTVTAPDGNLTADDVMGFQLKDSDNSVASSNLTVTVDLNQAPTAVNDLSYSTFENSSLSVLAASGVLANDTDPDAGDTKRVDSSTAASLGTVVLNSDGSFTFNPDNPIGTFDYLAAGENTVVSFTYTMKDAEGLISNIANVNITVNGVNDAPEGTNNTVVMFEDNVYTFSAADFGFTDPVDGTDDALLSVKITTLPAVGTLLNNGSSFIAGTFISIADINAGFLKFTPVTDGNGTNYSNFTFQVRDDGGTANGGVDLDQTPNTMQIDVTSVNDAPSGADKTVSTLEDTAKTFTAADFGFSDVKDSPNNFQSIFITALPGVGTGTLSIASGASVPAGLVTVGQEISVADIPFLTYTPTANANGTGYASFDFKVKDDGGTLNSGVDTDPTANKITIDVTSVNDAPDGANKTVSTNEDTNYTFTTADFGFTDASDSPANSLLAVTISSLPLQGVLRNDGVDITVAGASVLASDIAAGKLVFVPDANENGSGYANFDFKVQDNGGTANTGVDLDPVANKITIDVTSVNDAPDGANKTVSTNEDTNYTFTTADFGFSDASDSPANSLLAVTISGLPLQGVLRNDGVDITVAGASVLASDIAAGKLVFVPDANENGSGYANFDFKVQDNGGTANTGVDLDPVANKITIDVTSVNDAPDGANKTVSTNEDTNYTFTTADFGFSDASDSPANSLLAVTVSSLPLQGVLRNDGVDITVAGASVLASDIAAGKLVFVPDANENGSGYANFDFKVQDNGGTANTGIDLDPVANKITIDVTSVNDAPQGANNTVVTVEDTEYVFLTSDFGFSDPNDSPTNAFLNLLITSLPANGVLKFNDADVVSPITVSMTDIQNGNLTFLPDSDQSGTGYSSFIFKVQDDGGTSPGVDTDATDRTITIDVTADNDAPIIADAGSTVNYSISDGTPVVIDGSLTLSDVDDTNLNGAVITISSGALAGDALAATLVGGITSSYNSSTFELTLSGNSSLANYESVLESVTFSTSSATVQTRTITWQVDDGHASNNLSNLPTSLVDVVVPVFLDLNNDGIHLVSSSESPVSMDISGKGDVHQIGWTTPEDGVLVFDYDGGKQITSNEISFVAYAKDAKTDLEGLQKAFDSNKDNILDNQDSLFGKFGVWQDANNNGLVDSGEHQTLDQRGIVSISLISDNQQQMQNGNLIHGFSDYKTVDGHSYVIADVSLAIGQVSKGDTLHTNDILPAQNQNIDLSKVPEPAAPLPAIANDAHAVTAAPTPSAVETSVVAPPVITEHLPQPTHTTEVLA